MSKMLFIVWMCCCDWRLTVGRPSLSLSVCKSKNASSKTEASLNNFLWRMNIGKCFKQKKTSSDLTLWSMLWWWNQMGVVCYGTVWVLLYHTWGRQMLLHSGFESHAGIQYISWRHLKGPVHFTGWLQSMTLLTFRLAGQVPWGL